jgi:hypothetical protein
MTTNKNVEKTTFGYIVTWVKTETYLGKIMVFDKQGGKTPIYFNQNATKSWFINSGKFKVSYINTQEGKLYEQEMTEGSVFHAPPCMPAGLELLSQEGSISQISDKDDKEDRLYLSEAVLEVEKSPFV